MAGGNFIDGISKRRPGLYMNFVSAALASIEISERGTVVLPLVLDWGASKTFTGIENSKNGEDVKELLAHDLNDTKVLYIREALKRAKTVLVYRLNDGEKSKGTWGTTVQASVTAKHSGTRGNSISIKVDTNTVDDSKKDVKTYLDGKIVDVQSVANIEELQENSYVEFSGTGSIENTPGITLTGGTDGAVTNEDYTKFLSATETQLFNVIAFPVEDANLKTAFVSYIKRLRDDEGKKIVGVLPKYNSDYEGIINVTNGVKLIDGTVLTEKDCVAWVAGASARAAMIESLTYSVYEGAVDVVPRLTNSQYEEALRKGEFVFQFDGEKVKVEQDINSLVTYGVTKNKSFSKNRVIRTLDSINNDLLKTFSSNYIGKLNNTKDGQYLLSSAVDGYFLTLQKAGAVQNYQPGKDFVIDQETSVGDEVYATVAVQPVDSMEKFYFKVKIK